jgi:hypothetical protein
MSRHHQPPRRVRKAPISDDKLEAESKSSAVNSSSNDQNSPQKPHFTNDHSDTSKNPQLALLSQPQAAQTPVLATLSPMAPCHVVYKLLPPLLCDLNSFKPSGSSRLFFSKSLIGRIMANTNAYVTKKHSKMGQDG